MSKKRIAIEGLIVLGIVLVVRVVTYNSGDDFLPYALGYLFSWGCIRFIIWAFKTLEVTIKIKEILLKIRKNRKVESPSNEIGDASSKFSLKTGIYNGWNWLLWWRISSEEINRQVRSYDSLKVTQSARGLSFLFIIISSIVGILAVLWLLIMTLFLPADAANIISNRIGSGDLVVDLIYAVITAVILIVLAFFVRKGQRWAIITMMILATINLVGQPKFFLFWTVVMHPLYVALRVENVKRRYFAPLIR